jgi:signal transduction histidine kinase
MVSLHTSAIARSRDEVNALNIDLEGRVSERTAHLAELNEEVRRFAYIVTHDLRAPLVNIMGFTREIEESVKSITPVVDGQTAAAPEQGAPAAAHAWTAVHRDIPEAISFIRSSTQKMDALINAILKLSREGQRRLRYENIDLLSLASTTIAGVKHRLTAAEMSNSRSPLARSSRTACPWSRCSRT